MAQLLSLGTPIITHSAWSAFRAADTAPRFYIERHRAGDYGAITGADWEDNDRDVRAGQGKVLSAYSLPTGEGLILCTVLEGGRASWTCVMLCEEAEAWLPL